ncbi:MAG: hypothetical protein AAGH72_13555 [Verrucomicrobiota bacterium]
MKKILITVAVMWGAVVTIYAMQMRADLESGKVNKIIKLSGEGAGCSSSSSSSSE